MKNTSFIITATMILLIATACGEGGTTKKQAQTTTTPEQQSLTAREQTILNIFGRLNLADAPYENLNYWTDGDAYYRPFFFDADGEGEPRADGDTICFYGGTLHEGGWEMNVLLANDGKMTIAEDGWRFNKGDRVEYRTVGDETILVISDIYTEAIKTVLKKFDGGLYEKLIDDIYQYVLSGTFQRMEGSNDPITFNRKKSTVSGLMSKGETPYTLINEFGNTPVPVLRFSDDVVYKAVRTLIGINLIPIMTGADIDLEWQTETDYSKPVITLVKTAEGRSNLPPGWFPLTSVQVMTLAELRLYAGESYQENLLEMRHEIFARKGYIFTNFEWSSYYSNRDWYNPQYNDVTSKLTEIELINIELIQMLEIE
ncbi:MAG: YARHG domain-containing protein [Bacteroidales bacterium]|nr:YARHG domain-containing protein [Bacteroidales bacterium]